ncbi:MAG: hypothetical protein JNJ45_02910 [Chthonomonas sp.]|nr:hypothetical protein [Chthonomonas sp.]
MSVEGFMGKIKRQKFATQVSEELLARTREYAASEGKQLQMVVEEALADYLVKESGVGVRPFVLRHFEDSYRDNEELYKLLAQ